MLSIDDARVRVKRAFEKSQRVWAAALADPDSGLEKPEGARIELPLHPPTEKAALSDLGAAIGWADAWRHAPAEAEVIWEERRWPSVGTQTVPVRLRLEGAAAITRFVGAHARWVRLSRRALSVHERMPEPQGDLASAVRRHALAITEYGDAEFADLLDVVDWLAENPASGKRAREIPIRGVDTKWLETHRRVTEDLYGALTGADSLGLAESKSLIRVRFLDAGLRPGGIVDAALPLSGLAALSIHPAVVFVFENLESVLAMPDMPGAVVVHGSGYAAARIADVPWIRDARVVYWGDLDSDGFEILSRLHATGLAVESVLMDAATVERYLDLAGAEPRPAPGDYSALTPPELAALAMLRSAGGLRIEQERVPWAEALAHLRAAI